MYHVGRLGSYITRGVYTVSGPFHPFGGAVDIIVVEQPDGTFKSSPWYVRFGKFQGVLKAKEKEVTISVNGVDADSHMYLDQRGEAYFLREVEGEEGELVSSSSSSDETGEKSPKIRRPMKSKSCNYDGVTLNLDDQLDEINENSPKIRRPMKSKSCNYDAGNGQTDAGNGKITPRTRSRRSRILGLVFGRRSIKEDSCKDTDGVDGDGIVRISPLERAEIAANLLDVKWSTNLSSVKSVKDHVSVSFTNKSEQNGETISESDCSDTRNVDASEALGANGIQSSVGCQNSENSVIGLDSSKEESEETLHFSTRGPAEVRFCAETLRVTTELLPEGAVMEQAEQMGLENLQIESCDNYPHQKKASPTVCSEDEANLPVPLTLSEFDAEKVSVNPTHSLVEAGPINISSASVLSNPTENETNLAVKVNGDKIQTSRESVNDAEKLNGDYMIEAASAPISESSEEEQFPFSDFSDSKYGVADVEIEDRSSCSPLNTNYEASSFQDCSLQKDRLSSTDNLIDNSKIASNAIPIHVNTGAEAGRLTGSLPNMWSQTDNFGSEDGPGHLSRSLDSNFMSLEWRQPSKEKEFCTNSNRDNENQLSLEHSSEEKAYHSENIRNGVVNPAVEMSLCRHLLHEGMGAEAASQAFDSEKLDIDKLTSLGPTIVKNDRLIVRIGGHYFPWDAAAPIVLGIAAFGSEMIFEPKGMIPVDRVEKSLEQDPSKADVTSGGSWEIWPFRRSRSRKNGQLTPINARSTDVENSSVSNGVLDNDKSKVKPKMLRKKIRANTPTSEELASLNLKEGCNVVTFTFSTAMLGKQKVDARIFLWKWNTRIVISDVDGTITKSDVLGQFMPLVGVDWSQTGVAHLFSAIKENGYQLLFLSARAISQAYITRQFLVNLKQDGKALPDGPVVISPDGLFPSLFREVIRRAPHEFKIACLEDIKALFPSDCNPFYAGFGNRDTDEFSYLKVGIPKGKIFTINPKGEVSVHGRHHTKSYSSLHALVHGMFPAMSSSEQEDYNSWNFWRLPPPDIDT